MVGYVVFQFANGCGHFALTAVDLRQCHLRKAEVAGIDPLGCLKILDRLRVAAQEKVVETKLGIGKRVVGPQSYRVAIVSKCSLWRPSASSAAPMLTTGPKASD